MANNYWNEEAIKPKIIEYQNTEDEEERKRIYTQHLYEPLLKMTKAQLNTHRFYRFEPYDVLISVGLEHSYKQLDKYKPDYWVESKNRYARTFDYFSLVIKQAMFHYTKGREKKRGNKNIDDFYHIHYDTEQHYQLQWEYFCKYAETLFHDYFANRQHALYEKYWNLWQYIKSHDYTILLDTKRIFFKKARKDFPHYNNDLFRKILNFLYYAEKLYSELVKE